MAIANVVLKDKSGIPDSYEQIAHVNVKDSNGETRTYTDMTILSAYYATYDESTGKYTIVGQWFSSNGAGYACASSNGNYVIILTIKTLTKGESYLPSELGGV